MHSCIPTFIRLLKVLTTELYVLKSVQRPRAVLALESTQLWRTRDLGVVSQIHLNESEGFRGVQPPRYWNFLARLSKARSRGAEHS